MIAIYVGYLIEGAGGGGGPHVPCQIQEKALFRYFPCWI